MLRVGRIKRIKKNAGIKESRGRIHEKATRVESKMAKRLRKSMVEGEGRKGLREEERVFRQTGAVGSLLYICLSLSSPFRKIDVPRPGTKFQGRFQTKDRFRGNSRELIANNARALSG